MAVSGFLCSDAIHRRKYRESIRQHRSCAQTSQYAASCSFTLKMNGLHLQLHLQNESSIMNMLLIESEKQSYERNL